MNRSLEEWAEVLPSWDPDAKGIATRAASGKVLNALAPVLPELWGGSADLAESNNTHNAVYVVMFLCTTTSFVLFMAPAAHHRLMRRLKDRAAFKRSANRLIITGLIPLPVTMPLMTYFVVSDVVGRALRVCPVSSRCCLPAAGSHSR
jgi:hypothetical protein